MHHIQPTCGSICRLTTTTTHTKSSNLLALEFLCCYAYSWNYISLISEKWTIVILSNIVNIALATIVIVKKALSLSPSWNGHVHSSSQSMTSCVTKMAISRRLVTGPCNFIGYGPTLPKEERTDTRDRARYMADGFSDSLYCYSERIFSVDSFAGATNLQR